MSGYNPYLTLPRVIFEKPAASILLPVAVGPIIGYSTRPDVQSQFYRSLKQPPGNPPAWVFGPVWTALYASMGYAAYRAWTAGMNSFDVHTVKLAKQGATLYTIQLALNFLWMPLFFKFRRPVAAAVDIVSLTGITGYLTYIWGQVDPVAGLCLAPYVGWLSFATYLCTGAGYLNNWDFSKASRGEKA